MMKSYIKITLRHLSKSKFYYIINISGLSIGLACAMLIILYTKDELTFDLFHPNVNSIYRIAVDVRTPDGASVGKMGGTGIFHGPRFQVNIPEIQTFVRLYRTYQDMKLGDYIQSQVVMRADTNFFAFFSFPLLQGNPNTALLQPMSVVISQDLAKRYFGTEDALNKTILFKNLGLFEPYLVTGVAKRCPQNSSIQFDALLPIVIPVVEEQRIDNWVRNSLCTFVVLAAGTDTKAVDARMQQVFEKESKVAMDRVRSDGFVGSFFHQLQPFTDIHLSRDFMAEGGLVNGSDFLYSYILSSIAVFILLIACINFINLTIARSVKRAKEIGIRKVVGSGRKQLVRQFLGESFLLCGIAFLVALLLVQLMLPVFNNLVNKALSISYLLDTTLAAGYLVLFFITGLLAGFYPAYLLSGYSPVQTLYHNFRLSGRGYFQKSLVLLQFVLATLMTVAALVVYHQFDYLTTKELGYDDNHVIIVEKRNLNPLESKLFKVELMKNSDIEMVAPQGHSGMDAKINGDSTLHFGYETVDADFIPLLRIPMVQGRNFSPEFPSDSTNAVVVNEAFVKSAGWKDPIGQEVNMFPFNAEKRMVVGVVKDYHYASLSHAIGPLLFVSKSDQQYGPYEQMLIRIKPNSETTSLPHIQKTFKGLFPLIPYSYQFQDLVNLKNYEAEAKWKQMMLLGGLLTIFISCIGLFGMSILIAEKRFKEIAIRKLLGASVNTIVATLSKDLLILVSLALLMAIPLAYYVANIWLQKYPYRITVSAGMLVAAGSLVLLIALATVSYQSVKAALTNPVNALKAE